MRLLSTAKHFQERFVVIIIIHVHIFWEPLFHTQVYILQLQVMARALVSNEQGGPLAALRVSPGQPGVHRTLGGVVIHTAASLLSRRRVELLHPLVTMLCKPGDMAVS